MMMSEKFMAWVWRFFISVEADFSGILSVVVSRVSIGSKMKPSVPRMKER
jgi:hypothetical protein